MSVVLSSQAFDSLLSAQDSHHQSYAIKKRKVQQETSQIKNLLKSNSPKEKKIEQNLKKRGSEDKPVIQKVELHKKVQLNDGKLQIKQNHQQVQDQYAKEKEQRVKQELKNPIQKKIPVEIPKVQQSPSTVEWLNHTKLIFMPHIKYTQTLCHNQIIPVLPLSLIKRKK